MAIRDSARTSFRFLGRHIAIILILISSTISIFAAYVANDAVKELKRDRQRGCANAEVRANSLREVLIFFTRGATPDNQKLVQDYINNNLAEVHCDKDGNLTPVGSVG